MGTKMIRKLAMTPAEAQAFRDRWQHINAFEIRELRRTSAEVRLRQFFTLMGWAKAFGWEQQLAQEVSAVRRRWNRLRRAYVAQEEKQ